MAEHSSIAVNSKKAYNLFFGRVPFSDWRAAIEKLRKCNLFKEIVFVTDKSARKGRITAEREENVYNVYVPLFEGDWKRLYPQSASFVSAAENKLLFQQFMEKQSDFASFTPKTVKRSEPVFPCIVKKAVSYAGANIYIANDQKQLVEAIARFRNEQDYVVQEYIEHAVYGVAHFFAHNGQIVFQRVYERNNEKPFNIKRGMIRDYERVENHRFLPIFEQLFKSIAFSGAASVDFCTDPRTDDLKIFEINPRFGGSLVNNERDFLAMILAVAERQVDDNVPNTIDRLITS